MSKLSVLERVIVLICFNVPPWDFHKRQCRPSLLLDWDVIWVNFIPANHSQDTVIETAVNVSTATI